MHIIQSKYLVRCLFYRQKVRGRQLKQTHAQTSILRLLQASGPRRKRPTVKKAANKCAIFSRLGRACKQCKYRHAAGMSCIPLRGTSDTSPIPYPSCTTVKSIFFGVFSLLCLTGGIYRSRRSSIKDLKLSFFY